MYLAHQDWAQPLHMFFILCHSCLGLYPAAALSFSCGSGDPTHTQPGCNICSSLLGRCARWVSYASAANGKPVLAQPFQFTWLLPHFYKQAPQRAWKQAGFVLSFIAVSLINPLWPHSRTEDHLQAAARWKSKGLCYPRFLISSSFFVSPDTKLFTT